MDSLPLFPLGAVLLPSAPLALQVFEPRYRALVADLADRERPEFGVVGIRRGREVGGGTPDLAGVGCSAEILSREADDEDAVWAIAAVGRRRFRLEAVHDDRAPYLVGDVTWLDDGPDEVPPYLLGRLTDAFQTFLAALDSRAEGLPDDPSLLTTAVLEGLGLPLPEHQAVLEAGDAMARTQAVTALCRREQALAEVLHCRAARVTPSARLSPN